MAPRGTLLLFERVMPAGLAAESDALFEAAAADVPMLALTGGRERTEAEFGELLGRAGFALRRVVATNSPLALVEAAPN